MIPEEFLLGLLEFCLLPASAVLSHSFCDPVDSAHGIISARILEWVAMPFSIEFCKAEIQNSLLHPFEDLCLDLVF